MCIRDRLLQWSIRILQSDFRHLTQCLRQILQSVVVPDILSREKREAESAIIAFYNCLKAQVQKQINEADQDMRYADRFFFDQNGSAVELLTEMNAAIHNLSSSIQIYSSMDFRNNRSFAASDDLDAVLSLIHILY